MELDLPTPVYTLLPVEHACAGTHLPQPPKVCLQVYKIKIAESYINDVPFAVQTIHRWKIAKLFCIGIAHLSNICRQGLQSNLCVESHRAGSNLTLKY